MSTSRARKAWNVRYHSRSQCVVGTRKTFIRTCRNRFRCVRPNALVPAEALLRPTSVRSRRRRRSSTRRRPRRAPYRPTHERSAGVALTDLRLQLVDVAACAFTSVDVTADRGELPQDGRRSGRERTPAGIPEDGAAGARETPRCLRSAAAVRRGRSCGARRCRASDRRARVSLVTPGASCTSGAVDPGDDVRVGDDETVARDEARARLDAAASDAEDPDGRSLRAVDGRLHDRVARDVDRSGRDRLDAFEHARERRHRDERLQRENTLGGRWQTLDQRSDDRRAVDRARDVARRDRR